MDPHDYMEIHQLYAAYAHTMDAGDFAGWAGLFTPDGAWERVDGATGEVVFSVSGRADLEAFAREDYAARGGGTGRHWTGNIMLEGDGPRVRGRTYAFLIQAIDGAVEWIAHGNFDDDLVKFDEGWRFERRAVRLLVPAEIPSEAAATDRHEPKEADHIG
jgi:hypothetical protein